MENNYLKETVLLLFVLGNVTSHLTIDFNVGSTFAFQTLQQKLKTKQKSFDCPYPYQRSGELCLYADCTRSLNWDSARFFCQTNAGISGDLVIFENACQFRNIITYLNEKVGAGSSSLSCPLWAGASNGATSPSWKFIDGTILPSNGIFWNSLMPDGTLSKYAFFDKSASYYLSQDIGTASKAPLCQYFPKIREDDHHHHR